MCRSASNTHDHKLNINQVVEIVSTRASRSRAAVKYDSEEGENDEEEVEQEDEEDNEDEEDQFEEEVTKKTVSHKKKSSPSTSTVVVSASVSSKRKTTGKNENPLNRFGFSVMTEDEVNEQKKNTPAKHDKTRNNASIRSVPNQKSGRSSSRVAAIAKNTEEGEEEEDESNIEDSSPEEKIKVKKNNVPKRSTRSKIEEDSDAEEADINIRKSSRTRTLSKDYADPKSDDEFVGDGPPKRESKARGKGKQEVPKAVKKKSKDSDAEEGSDDDLVISVDGSTKSDPDDGSGDHSSDEEAEEGEGEESDESSSDTGDKDEVEYKIQHVLTRQSMPPSQWRDLCGPMNTRYVRPYVQCTLTEHSSLCYMCTIFYLYRSMLLCVCCTYFRFPVPSEVTRFYAVRTTYCTYDFVRTVFTVRTCTFLIFVWILYSACVCYFMILAAV